jgi:hypothetical protein
MAKNPTLTRITNKARSIRHKGEPWIHAVKRASKLVMASLSPSKKAAKKKARKVGAVKKKSSSRQTGGSNLKIDRRVHAKSPGKRTVKHAGGKKTVYYERRKNRSDKPGSLTGGLSAYRYNVMQRLTSNVRQLTEAEKRLKHLQSLYKITPKGIDKTKVKSYITDQKKFISSLKHDIGMLKRLVK